MNQSKATLHPLCTLLTYEENIVADKRFSITTIIETSRMSITTIKSSTTVGCEPVEAFEQSRPLQSRGLLYGPLAVLNLGQAQRV